MTKTKAVWLGVTLFVHGLLIGSTVTMHLWNQDTIRHTQEIRQATAAWEQTLAKWETLAECAQGVTILSEPRKFALTVPTPLGAVQVSPVSPNLSPDTQPVATWVVDGKVQARSITPGGTFQWKDLHGHLIGGPQSADGPFTAADVAQ